MNPQSSIGILIVDDHPILRSGLKQSLKELDFVTVVGEAGDGRGAIKEALRLHPDIILMDLGLPGMDGIEASWMIKKELPRTRIIIFTSSDNTEDITSALGVGADGYCLKHASTKRIASAIESVLRGEVWLDPELAETAVQRKRTEQERGSISRELTVSETCILELVAKDMEVGEIAEQLGLTSKAVSALMRQMIIKNSKEAEPEVNLGKRNTSGLSLKDSPEPPGENTKAKGYSREHLSPDWFSATVDTSDGLILADKYLLQGLLGAGGIGVVFKAKHLYMDRTVAIKFLKAEFRDEGRVARAFQQEAKALANLNHKNIVNVYDFGVSSFSQPFLVMEFLNGIDLDAIFNRAADRRMPISKFLPIFLQVTEALAVAHASKVIHCDLKPSNILILPGGKDGLDEVKIVDFGLAKMIPHNAGKQAQATDSYMVDGTPSYMPPEQCSGRPIDHRADIYALGCVMYEAIAGLNPFKAETPIEIFAKQIQFVPPPISGFLPDVDVHPALVSCIAKMLAKDPGMRYQSMIEIHEILQTVAKNSKKIAME